MNRATLMIAAAAALGAAVLGTWAATLMRPAEDAFAACRAGQVAGGSIGGPFTLVDENGVTVTDAQVFNAPTIVYFGYTFCPDICPMDVQRNAFALEVLEQRGIIANGVFITIDPARDTVDVVRDFTAAFHPRMIGLTGSPEQIDAASSAWRVLAQKGEAAEDEFYLMNHSTFSYLAMPGIGFVEVFNRETTPEALADTVACYVDAASN